MPRYDDSTDGHDRNVEGAIGPVPLFSDLKGERRPMEEWKSDQGERCIYGF